MEKPQAVVAAPTALGCVQVIDWDLCCICQKRHGSLITPNRNPTSGEKLGYLSLGKNLDKLKPFNFELESGFKVDSLFVENDLATSLNLKEAKYHKTCYTKYTVEGKFQAILKTASLATQKTEADVEETSPGSSTSERRQTRSSVPLVNVKEFVCFLCKEPANSKHPLRHCATDKIYHRVKSCAEKLGDTELIAVLSAGDLVSIEGKYHPICLARLYNKDSRRSCVTNDDYERVLCEGIAFADLLLYMQAKLNANESITFKMGTIVQMYQKHLAQLLDQSVDSNQVHTTRFREKILAHFPFLIAEKSGREYILRRQGAIGVLHREDQDEVALNAHYFLKRIRKGMKEVKSIFSGRFEQGCEEACIPGSLLAVVNTLLYGSPVHTQCRECAKSVMVSCTDTDILVLCTSFFHSLQASGLQELWILLGVGNKRRFIAVHQIAECLGNRKANALKGFHAFTGCDSVSFFASCGKPTAWTAWKDNDELTEAFIRIGDPSMQLDEAGELETALVSTLEKYTVAMYRGDASLTGVDEARKALFCSGDREITSIPPTKGALQEHIKRAAYQAGQVWGKADQLLQTLTSPQGWGWTLVNGIAEPVWSKSPPIWSVCRELDRCGCATKCGTNRCCCRRHNLPCAPACKICKGGNDCLNKSFRES